MQAPVISEIKLVGSRLCEVTVGTSRRVYLTSRRAVGMALLQESANESSPESDVVWTDMLTSHGVAIGTADRARIVVAVIPEAKRTVTWTGTVFTSPTDAIGRPGEPCILELTFPPCVAMLRITGNQYAKASLSCVKPDALKTLSVRSDASALASFPYGNVYASESRVCWGTVEHATVNTIEALLDTFFQSGFNNDLFSAGACGLRVRNLPELVQSRQSLTTTALPPPVDAYFNTSVSAQVRAIMGVSA